MGPATTLQQERLARELEAYFELQKPIYHLPIDLGISAFKRELNIPGLSKKLRNKLVKAYKKRAWAEYHGKARDRGTFPVHNANINHVAVDTAEEETKIKVKKK